MLTERCRKEENEPNSGGFWLFVSLAAVQRDYALDDDMSLQSTPLAGTDPAAPGDSPLEQLACPQERTRPWKPWGWQRGRAGVALASTK